MKQPIDIRDHNHLTGDDIVSLNFIRPSSRFCFRKYYRSGLRSHIFEVLDRQDHKKEIHGIVKDGVKTFPRACPKKMFRIFRDRFTHINDIFDEIQKYTLLLSSLGSEFIALSEEFIVDYLHDGQAHILLCGLQEYVEGEILDPWKITDQQYLHQFFKMFFHHNSNLDRFVLNAKKNIARFTQKIRQMIINTHLIPDLAGLGNLLLSPDGQLKLVDINNIVSVAFSDDIQLDDKGYPSCDVSIHVLFMLETTLLGKPVSDNDPLLFFMQESRKERVRQLEIQFYDRLPV
jgi:hypothetical protein